MERKLELEIRIQETLHALDLVCTQNQVRGGYDEQIDELESDLMWYRGELADIDAELWENMILIESDDDPLPKLSNPTIRLSDEEVPF